MTLRRVLLTSLLLLATVPFTILYIDHPLARFFSGFDTGHAVFTSSPLTLPVMPALAVFGIVLGVGHLVLGRKPPEWVEAWMLAGIAVLAGQFLAHEVFKPIFGRIVPSIYLETGQHGFHWFRHASGFGAFPSGHSTEAAALLSIAWAYYPRWRWAFAGLMAVLALALMLGQWHFLSDILAGTAVGILVGAATLWAWRRTPF